MASTIIFDFDGTLHDTVHVYGQALRRGYQLLVEQGVAPERELTDAYAAGNLGLTARDAWARVCPDLPWSVTQTAAALVGETMDELVVAGQGRLYDGVPELLQQLKDAGHTLVFLSNCRNAYRDAVRRSFGFDAWFEHYYTAEQFDGAPKERIFETIRQEVPGPYIVVGDRDKDAILAQTHSLPFIGCLYGFGTLEELTGAPFLAKEPAQIAGYVERIEARGSARLVLGGDRL